MPAILRAGNHFTVPTARNAAPPRVAVDLATVRGLRARARPKVVKPQPRSFIGPRVVYELRTTFAPIRPGPIETRGEHIIEAVCRVFEVTRVALMSPRRKRQLIPARFATYMLLRDLTSKSLPEIGRMIGDRDHTTVMHGIRMAEKWMNDDRGFKFSVERVLDDFR